MFANNPNVAMLAAAGSRKTEQIIETALDHDGRVLVATFTNENLRQINRRIEDRVGTVPARVDLMSWFTFLIRHGAKPYQSSMLGSPFVLRGLNFDGEPSRYTGKAEPNRYYVDRAGNLYRKNLADFVVQANAAADGAVVDRISRIYDVVLVDELQDLVGWDLEVLALLLGADVNLLMVGDPRQHTYGTNTSSKHRKYRGIGMSDWIDQQSDLCERIYRDQSYRCHQKICDFADAVYPDMPTTTSVDVPDTGHDGIFTIPSDEVHGYVKEYSPRVLRPTKAKDTLGLDAMNIGVAKGSTFDRVLIFPTNPMKEYLADRDPTKLRAPESLYVGVTRARFSATFVVD